jgi:hypothetical protein
MSPEASLTLLPPTPALELGAVHELAVNYGARDTGAAREIERLATPTKLLCLATRRLPDLSLSTFIVQTLAAEDSDPRIDRVVGQLKVQAAGSLRLAQRALEVHARNVGYRLDEWGARTLETASALIDSSHRSASRGEPYPTPLDELRHATRALCQAVAACECDRMAVPESITDAIARLLLLFMLAGELDRRNPTGRQDS